MSSQSSHHPQEVLLAQFSLYVHKGGLKPDSFHFITTIEIAFFRGKVIAAGNPEVITVTDGSTWVEHMGPLTIGP